MRFSKFLENCSSAKRLLFAACSAGLLAFGASACGPSGGDGNPCPEGEKQFEYNGSVSCYETCGPDEECPSGTRCVNDTLCEPVNTDDAMTMGDGDAGTEDAISCTEEGKSCEEIFSCAIKCRDETCIDNCVQQGSCDGQSNWDDYNTCTQDQCGENAAATCVEDKCESQIRTCELVDNANCKDLQVCQTKCLQRIRANAPSDASPEELQQLYAECIADSCDYGTIKAQKQDSRIRGCIQQNCPQDSEDTAPDCEWNQCEQQYKSCSENGVFGSKSCKEVDLCVADCGSAMNPDFQCEADCIWQGSKDARALRDNWNGCINTCFQKFPDSTEKALNCTFQTGSAENSDGETKDFENCKQYRDQCGEIGSTHQTCAEIRNCIRNASGKDVQRCVYDGTASAQKNLFGFNVCGRENGCFSANNPQTCFQNNCQKWLDACTSQTSGG